ncbi:MAG: hypothetical protein WC828_09800 [Thermoleophilia bacterium]|jgi:hypothetical protein
MSVSENIISKVASEEFHICEICGYERGFHTSFQRREEGFEVILICPECGQRYRVGWTVKLD